MATHAVNGEYTLEYLESLPTLLISQADDLKIKTPHREVWLSRCHVEDGEPFDNRVTELVWDAVIEEWVVVAEYPAVEQEGR